MTTLRPDKKQNFACPTMEQTEPLSRGKWKNKIEGMLSCIGYAVGLANIWRFPYLAYKNGGGAFLVPFLIIIVSSGIPMFFMESALGQFSSTGCLTVFKICPLFKGVGYAIMVVNLISSTYLNILETYPLMFLMYAFKDPLPWSHCDNQWNTKDCIKLKVGSTRTLANHSLYWNTNGTAVKTPADEFFHREILKISSGIEEIGSIDTYLLLCNILSWLIVYLCIMRGIKSVGKVVYFTAVFPYVILFCLLIRGLTLPGAWDGIYFYIWPEWNQLKNMKVWAEAGLQMFFALGPGWGGVVNISSYNDFKNNCKLDSIITPLVHCATSVLSGFVVFSVIGFMAYETGQPISTVASGGPGLAFITYPAAISLMPWPNLWAVLFFFMLINVGLDTLFVIVETVVSAILDVFPYLRKFQFFVTLITVGLAASFSIIYCTNSGMYWLLLLDSYAATISVVLICFSEVVIVAWTYGAKRFIRDVEFMIGKKVSRYWIISWKFVTPLILKFVFVTAIAYNTTSVSYLGYELPEWTVYVGWGSCFASIACIPLYMVYRLLYIEKGGLIQRITHSLKPLPDWGPAKAQDRSEWTRETMKCYLKEKVIDMEVVNHQQLASLCNNGENK